MADEESDPLVVEKRALASDFSNAVVREISYAEAQNLILANEWLGNMGTTEFSFGLYFGDHLAGVACFGRTAGTKVAESVCGVEHAHRVVTLCRGACVHWAHPHSASFLINAACREMASGRNYNLFIGYSDFQAGEIGTVYQASNWLYCGSTSPTEKFRTPSGEMKDARLVSAYSRDRTGGTLKYRRSRLSRSGCSSRRAASSSEMAGANTATLGIYGDRRTKRLLRNTLRWEVLPYPKRAASPENQIQVIDLDPVPKTFAASCCEFEESSSRSLCPCRQQLLLGHGGDGQRREAAVGVFTSRHGCSSAFHLNEHNLQSVTAFVPGSRSR